MKGNERGSWSSCANLPPRFDAQCPDIAGDGIPPEITSPQKGITYSLRLDRVGEETIPFRAVSDADASSLYWFVDERLVAKLPASDTYLWNATPGKFVVRVLDEYGRADSREIEVSVVE